MDYIRINKMITKSIYKQIADSIRKAIDHGLLKYNDRIPTEKEICQAFSISQTTVKQAYETLISEGKIKRIKGKGTYVTNRDILHTRLHSFVAMEAMNEKDHPGMTRDILLFDRSKKDLSAVRALQLQSDEKYIRIVSIFQQHNNPKLLQRLFLSEKLVQPFDASLYQKNTIYDIIKKEYNVTTDHLHSTFSAINATKADAMLLNIKVDDAIYLIRTKILDNNNEVIAYICNYYPGAFTEIEVTVYAK